MCSVVQALFQGTPCLHEDAFSICPFFWLDPLVHGKTFILVISNEGERSPTYSFCYSSAWEPHNFKRAPPALRSDRKLP